jgi:chromosome segregation ATPase
MPYASTTDVLVRSMTGPKGGLREVDAPPPRPPAPPIELDYPHIATRPEYKAEEDKLNHFAKQKDEAEAKLADLYKQIEAKAKSVEPTTGDVISRAEALLAGEEPGLNLHAEYQATNKRISVLRAAVEAQHIVLRSVTDQLSRAAGRRYQDEHKQRIKRIIAAVDELNAANRSEQALRNDLHRLGYTGETLPAMHLQTVEDPNAVCENVTYYWYKEAKRYSQSATEIAADLRKSRLAAALAG